MYRSFFQSVAKRAKGSICYSKRVKGALGFIGEKYVVKNFILKRKLGNVNSY